MKTILTVLSLSLTTVIGCGEKTDDTSTIDDTTNTYQCPTVEEDTCMTEELYEQCLEVVETCDSGNIVVAESCPYASFSCME